MHNWECAIQFTTETHKDWDEQVSYKIKSHFIQNYTHSFPWVSYCVPAHGLAPWRLKYWQAEKLCCCCFNLQEAELTPSGSVCSRSYSCLPTSWQPCSPGCWGCYREERRQCCFARTGLAFGLHCAGVGVLSGDIGKTGLDMNDIALGIHMLLEVLSE